MRNELIKNIILQIKKIRRYFIGKKIWNDKMSEHLEIRILSEPKDEEDYEKNMEYNKEFNQ